MIYNLSEPMSNVKEDVIRDVMATVKKMANEVLKVRMRTKDIISAKRLGDSKVITKRPLLITVKDEIVKSSLSLGNWDT